MYNGVNYGLQRVENINAKQEKVERSEKMPILLVLNNIMDKGFCIPSNIGKSLPFREKIAVQEIVLKTKIAPKRNENLCEEVKKEVR